MFTLPFFHLNLKMLSQDWFESMPELVIGSEVVEHVGRFNCLGSLVRQDRLVFDEIPTQIHKLQLPFASLHHLWCRRDIRLIKDEYTTQQFARSYLMAMKIDL